MVPSLWRYEKVIETYRGESPWEVTGGMHMGTLVSPHLSFLLSFYELGSFIQVCPLHHDAICYHTLKVKGPSIQGLETSETV